MRIVDLLRERCGESLRLSQVIRNQPKVFKHGFEVVDDFNPRTVPDTSFSRVFLFFPTDTLGEITSSRAVQVLTLA